MSCTRTARQQITVVPDRNTIILSDNQKPDNVLVVTEIGTMTRKTEGAPNTKPSRTITDFLWKLGSNAIIHALNAPDKNVSGFTMEKCRKLKYDRTHFRTGYSLRRNIATRHSLIPQ